MAPSSVLNILAALCLAFSTASALYVPPAFSVDAVPRFDSGTPPRASDIASRRGLLKSTTQDAMRRKSSSGDESVTAAGTFVLGARDIWSPVIESPQAHTVWTVGSTVNVTWDTLHPPKHVTNDVGKIFLGYFEGSDEGNEHLDFGKAECTDPTIAWVMGADFGGVLAEHPLAEGFSLRKGRAEVQVPLVKPSDEYASVQPVFGDSANRSPKFAIVEPRQEYSSHATGLLSIIE